MSKVDTSEFEEFWYNECRTCRFIDISGRALAMIISWEQHHSIFWAVFQGYFGWFYITYWYFMGG